MGAALVSTETIGALSVSGVTLLIALLTYVGTAKKGYVQELQDRLYMLETKFKECEIELGLLKSQVLSLMERLIQETTKKS